MRANIDWVRGIMSLHVVPRRIVFVAFILLAWKIMLKCSMIIYRPLGANRRTMDTLLSTYGTTINLYTLKSNTNISDNIVHLEQELLCHYSGTPTSPPQGGATPLANGTTRRPQSVYPLVVSDSKTITACDRGLSHEPCLLLWRCHHVPTNEYERDERKTETSALLDVECSDCGPRYRMKGSSSIQHPEAMEVKRRD